MTRRYPTRLFHFYNCCTTLTKGIYAKMTTPLGVLPHRHGYTTADGHAILEVGIYLTKWSFSSFSFSASLDLYVISLSTSSLFSSCNENRRPVSLANIIQYDPRIFTRARAHNPSPSPSPTPTPTTTTTQCVSCVTTTTGPDTAETTTTGRAQILLILMCNIL